MPPREEMDPWQQPPPGTRDWRDHRSATGYYSESRQPPPFGAPPTSSPYPPPPYRSSRPPPLPMRRMPPPPGDYGGSRRGSEAGYYERGWQEAPPPRSRLAPQQLPYRAPEERPYMPMYEEMRLEQAPPPSQPQVRIQFRPNSGTSRQHLHHAAAPPSGKTPTKQQKESSKSSSEKDKEKDGDSLSLLAKVSFAMQTSPTASQDEEDKQGSPGSEKSSPKERKEKEDKEKEGKVQETPKKKEQPPQDTPSPPDQKLPAPSPLLAASSSSSNNNTALSPITPECWTPKHSNQSPSHRRNHSAGSGILRTPRGGLTPLITPASARKSSHRRVPSTGADSTLYHQRWGSFAEGPQTPHAYSPHGPPPPPTPGDTPYGGDRRDYLTMEQIATPPDARGAPPPHHGMTPPQQHQQPRRGGYPLPPPPQYRNWDREQQQVWRSREPGYERPPYEEYPPILTRGSSYEEEGGPPRYARYPPPPEAYERRGGGGYWREPYPPPPEGAPSYATPRRMETARASTSRMPPYMPPYSQNAVTPTEEQGPPMEGDPMYQTAPYTYVQQPRLEEKTILRKKFSWKHYPELERFLIANRDEYLRHSALNYTAEQKQYNNWLTERLLELAARHNYEFDPEEFNFVAVRDRIRCYYKSYVQTARKRGLVIHGKPALPQQKRARTEEGQEKEEEEKEEEQQQQTEETAKAAASEEAAATSSTTS